ncbi:MAG: O-antigen ligase family protein [Anaerolineales bacterium]|nr:O-antigen ligase family protein [Anaerolineales bacterium]
MAAIPEAFPRLSAPRLYLLREALLILLWAYVILIGGGVNGLVTFRVQLLSTLLMLALGGLWLGGLLLRRQAVPRAGLEWAALVFLGAQLVTVLLSQDVRRSLPLPAQAVAYIIIFYGAYTLTRSGWPAELTEKTLLIVGSIVIGLAGTELAQRYLSWLALTAGQTVAPDFQYRLYSVFGDANLLSSFLNILTPPALARALVTPRRATRILLLLWLIAALGVQAFTLSRGGQVGLAVALGVLATLWIAVVSEDARARAVTAWGWLRARPALLFVLAAIAAAMFAFAVYRVFTFEGSATQGPATQARSLFWGAAWQAFTSSPIWGTGPGTFPTAYMRYSSSPPDRIYLHAHSVAFTTAAESGLIGLGAVIFVVVAIAVALWKARHKPGFAARARWAAVAASWAGFLAHSQVDDHTRYLAVALPLAILLGCTLAEESEARPTSFHPLWLLLPGLAAALFTGYSLRAYALSEQAVEAGDDWARAAQLFDQAANADPALAFYWQQAGYAYGRLAAEGDTAALEAGIARLERARDLEPAYAVTHANLAALYWQAGRRADALAAMQQATQLAPLAATYHLNLGLYAEALSQPETARAAYRRFLSLRAASAGLSFWSETPVRREALATATLPESPPLERVRALVAAGQLNEAEQELLAAWRDNTQLPWVYTGLAELARARGDWALAERQIENALWVQNVQIEQQVDALLTAGEIAHAQGRTAEALIRYENVWWAVSEYGSLGWGSAGWTPHAYFAYQRRALPVDELPQLARADLSPEMARRLLPLGELRLANGQPEKAADLYRALLRIEPALDEARVRLAELGLSP